MESASAGVSFRLSPMGEPFIPVVPGSDGRLLDDQYRTGGGFGQVLGGATPDAAEGSAVSHEAYDQQVILTVAREPNNGFDLVPRQDGTLEIDPLLSGLGRRLRRDPSEKFISFLLLLHDLTHGFSVMTGSLLDGNGVKFRAEAPGEDKGFAEGFL